jgi:putative membrane protein
MKADHFFTPEEKERIKTTTHSVESRTDGEIAVMVVDQSDRYPDAEILGGIIFGGLLSLVVSDIFFNDSLFYFIPFSFILFFPFRWIGATLPWLKLLFIGPHRKQEAVRRRAVQAFYEKGLYKTRYHTGVLIFLSLLEHKVWILADTGIYEKMTQETLNRFSQEVSSGVKEGRACQSLCQAIEGIGQLLAQHFPITPGYIDELTDEVMTE